MNPKKKKNRRPGILVRFYPSDLELLNRHCQDACTPRENFIRRSVLASIRAAAIGRDPMPVDPEQMTLAEAQSTVALGKAITAAAHKATSARRLTPVKSQTRKDADRLTRKRNKGRRSTAA